MNGKECEGSYKPSKIVDSERRKCPSCDLVLPNKQLAGAAQVKMPMHTERRYNADDHLLES